MEWIKCEDQMPKNAQDVICLCRAGNIQILSFDDGIWYDHIEHNDYIGYMRTYVKYWMPLPERPSEQKKTTIFKSCLNCIYSRLRDDGGLFCDCKAAIKDWAAVCENWKGLGCQ